MGETEAEPVVVKADEEDTIIVNAPRRCVRVVVDDDVDVDIAL